MLDLSVLYIQMNDETFALLPFRNKAYCTGYFDLKSQERKTFVGKDKKNLVNLVDFLICSDYFKKVKFFSAKGNPLGARGLAFSVIKFALKNNKLFWKVIILTDWDSETPFKRQNFLEEVQLKDTFFQIAEEAAKHYRWKILTPYK